MFPEKLKQGDEIRVISPAESLAIVAEDQKQLAVQRMTDAGFIVTFSTYADEHRSLHSNPIEHRISDLHEAFLDPAVKAVWTTLGGYDSNQLLRYIDYELIGRNPKIFADTLILRLFPAVFINRQVLSPTMVPTFQRSE